MLDVKYVLANLDKVIEGLRFRNVKVDFETIRALSNERKAKCQRYDQLRFEQRQASDQMRTLNKEQAAELRNQLKAMSTELKAIDARRAEIDEELAKLMLYIPNIPADDVPQAADEEGNVEIRRWGTPREFSFTPKDHADLGEALGILDFERGTKVSGSRFTFMKGQAARLELALIQFMMDCHSERGYELVIPPYIVNRASMTGTGQLPKFEDDAYKTNEDGFSIEDKKYLSKAIRRERYLCQYGSIWKDLKTFIMQNRSIVKRKN